MNRKKININLHQWRKLAATIGVCGLVLCIGGSNKNERFKKITEEQSIINDDSESNKIIEQDFSIIYPAKNIKQELLDQIEYADFDSLKKDILKSIVKESKEEDSVVIEEIRNACHEKDAFISSVIFEMAKKEEKEKNYQLKRLKIFNNLDKRQKNLPKQILLMNHYATFGKYKFYQMIESRFHPFLAFVTDRKDHVLFAINFMNSNKEVRVKNTDLKDFSKLLIAYNVKKKEKYTYQELCEDLSFKLSKKMNNHNNTDFKTFKTKDIVVLDTDKVEIKANTDQRYYFLKYSSPYLFASKTDSYIDIFNLNAHVTIGKDHALYYQDFRKNIVILDSTRIGNIESYIQSFREFLCKKNISNKKYISYHELLKINKKVNKKDNKVKVKTK